ncbi:MAG: arginine--tRNA ligase [Bacteroidia bacterium]|nr:arginine--tRNA ligase [Bacteroidia bacterium]
MLTIFSRIQEAAAAAVESHYGVSVDASSLSVQETRKDFEGDFTLVTFPLTKFKLGAPQQIGETLGGLLQERMEEVVAYNVVKGFLNLSLSQAFWLEFLASAHKDDSFFRNTVGNGKKVVVEYCSPNTNKPLHLGHLRNIVLGYSLTQILDANGYEVHPTILFNDRGTNISKSMVSWQMAGKNDTPESAGKKGDKFVGDYYVEFGLELAAQAQSFMDQGLNKRDAEKQTAIMQQVNDMTIAWEAEDPEIRELWKRMNGYVYDAVNGTFKRLGVAFESFYYESAVYKRGKETVEEGLEKGVFYEKEDGAIEVDLTEEGLDKKLMLRSNGTSLYITQDLAVAEDKYKEFGMDKSIYVVGNEQDYHFKVLFSVLKKLGVPYSEGLFHLSYGMVELKGGGKMKTREGTTVEADDLMDDMIGKAREESQKNPDKILGMSEEELDKLYNMLGIGALKYYLVKVDPKKRMIFDPDESIDLKGNTGPFIQYSYTRTQAVLRKANADFLEFSADNQPEETILDSERSLMKLIQKFPEVLQEAGESYNPSLIGNYAFELAKEYNRFYHEAPILNETKPKTSQFRLALSSFAGNLMKECLRLIGVDMPDRM